MLEVRLPVEPDEHGVFDGVQLAQAMIYDAAAVLLPYVRSCPACLDALFSKIANQALESMHQDLREGQKRGLTFAVGPEGPAKDAAIQAHLDASVETIRAMLEGSEAHRH